jgi:cbb3-type cytochrome oxidase maturation protein
MSLLLIAIPVSALLALVALGSFVWAVRSGQLEDLDRSGMHRLLSARNDAEAQADEDGERDPSGQSAPAPHSRAGRTR